MVGALVLPHRAAMMDAPTTRRSDSSSVIQLPAVQAGFWFMCIRYHCCPVKIPTKSTV